jgi:hypothetical protein
MWDNPIWMIFIIRWNVGPLIYRFILNSRFRQVIQIRESGKKSHPGQNHLRRCPHFCPNLYSMGLMTVIFRTIPVF